MLGVVVFKNCINLDMCSEHMRMVSCSFIGVIKTHFSVSMSFRQFLASLLNFFNIRKKVHTL